MKYLLCVVCYQSVQFVAPPLSNACRDDGGTVVTCPDGELAVYTSK